MASTSTLGLRVPRSPAAIFTALYAVVGVGIFGPALYDPTSLQKQLSISEPVSARFIAFCLVAIKAYEGIGALQDNQAVYWCAVAGRLGAASLMIAEGGEWAKIAPIDIGSAVILAVCVLFFSNSGAKGKKA